MRPARLAHQRSDIPHGRCAGDGYPGASVTKGVTRDNASVLASSGCLTLYGGVRQPIVVNSSPAGAQVTLNGQPVGTAPVEVTVDRGSRPALRVESDGFEPAVLRPRRRVNRWIALRT